MPISGLVIVLGGHDASSDAAVNSIRVNPSFTISAGETTDRVPVVLETATDAQSRAQIAWVRDLPGVAMVEVAYVNFAGATASGPGQHKERPRHGP